MSFKDDWRNILCSLIFGQCPKISNFFWLLLGHLIIYETLSTIALSVKMWIIVHLVLIRPANYADSTSQLSVLFRLRSDWLFVKVWIVKTDLSNQAVMLSFVKNCENAAAAYYASTSNSYISVFLIFLMVPISVFLFF